MTIDTRIWQFSATILATLTLAPLPTTAQTCDYSPSGNAVAYVTPPNGTKLVYEDIILHGDAEQRRRELSYTANGGTAEEIDWVIETPSGQDLAVRTFLGLIQTANSSGTASDFDRIRYAKLWPLDTGKSIVLPIITFGQSGRRYSSELSLCVRRFEALSLPAGHFDTVVIDGYNRIVADGDTLPFDEVYTRYWYAPQFGIYVQRVRAMYRQRREVMKQTRRAIRINE